MGKLAYWFISSEGRICSLYHALRSLFSFLIMALRMTVLFKPRNFSDSCCLSTQKTRLFFG